MKSLSQIVLVSVFLVGSFSAYSQKKAQDPPFLQYVNSPWVDSIMQTLSPDERISQLLMVAAYSNRGEKHKQEILKLIEEQKIGGLIFFQGDPESQVNLMNEYQEASKVPLLGAIDAEWGIGMRLDNTISYPFQMALGAIQDDELIYRMGDEIARQVKRAGLHLNFAPVVDVNNNPNNPVINFRSFGEDKYNTVIAFFKNPYVLNKLDGIENVPGLLLTYQDSNVSQELAAQLIFGGVSAGGKLPVSVGDKFRLGDGLDVKGEIRLSYSLPEKVGMDSRILFGRIDSLMQQAMDAKAIPGGQILVAKDRKVVMYKAYGEHIYNDTITVERDDLYDLASVTKISSVMPALMKLYDEGEFRLDQTLANHLRSFRRSNKSDIPYHDILTHQARFQPWIPFWKNTLRNNGSYRWWTIKKDSSARYPIKITDQMFLHRNYPDKIVRAIKRSPLLEEKEYVYSDFFFILGPRVVESMTDEDFVTYLQENFYEPLGATTLTYNPLKKYPGTRIVPTEHDYLFRNEPIHGTVHDEGAIMLGGVSGHAGLFANANDLAKLMQMYLDMGEYGGRRYIEESTMQEFTRTQFPENNNRRALGFDKPALEYTGKSSNTAKDASRDSFGHTGFTGTMVWMDPQQNLLYVFLSNRVAPTRNNTRLYQLNTRTEIQQVLYDALQERSDITSLRKKVDQ